MLRALGLILWTGSAVWFGTFIATARYGGKTPMEHFARVWEQSPADEKVEEVKSRVKETLEDAKDSLAHDANTRPRERHSEKDREEVNKLIAAKAKR